jgi:hypothetical protein
VQRDSIPAPGTNLKSLQKKHSEGFFYEKWQCTAVCVKIAVQNSLLLLKYKNSLSNFVPKTDWVFSVDAKPI